MSHFSVLVIGDNVEGQLAPFQENNMGDCPKQYLEFTADEDSEVDDITGKKGYWKNPNAKWDWYRVGGRWAGHFKLKDGATAPAPVPGYEVKFGQELPEENTADVIRKRDIDFASMRADAAHDAAMEYDYIAGIFGDLPPHAPWSEFSDISNMDERRKTYRAQPRIMAWDTAAKAMTFDERRKAPFDLSFGNADDFLVSREQYIAAAVSRAGTTFAVLNDGKWHERGEMGWWACVSNEKDPETWCSMFQKLMDDLPDDTLLTVVDCHI